ncbi:MAG TPA: hypothetical protein VJI98_03370 [Candidatus Nanoarchaeia archaeon]|nr:hypothetical protein [Candidatus Nanoarchaeia archaeon]
MRILLLTALACSIVIINLYFRSKTFNSLDREIKKLNWFNLEDHEYIQKSYNFVADRFIKVNRCWLKYPWRNLFLKNLWKIKKSSLPCHMQNILFQRFLRKRFKPKHIKTLATWSIKKGLIIHFYSRIKIKNKWVDVDVWGKKWGIPFGKNVRNSELVN